ncbi:class I SAM-dependent methyltransferase [Sporosarcina gallistercoris]|uniref:Class I SAM-dependent methyltransferase n=1 Tax=Sporosarcina gallistercoris TaxID=2762245 RepID=A0ABR8PJL2_9BACL|nr:class I SAM-dependent methyltransferase [Sporosarcina gallistercoris]MBD7908335.1 class I SAM-dependent methyltransferase [Sporosarcina gallistercoris]
MNSVVISTAGRPDELSQARASAVQQALGYEVIPRNKRSVAALMATYESDVLIAGKERYELYRRSMCEPFFFHPDTAAFRLKRLMKGETDPLVEAGQLTPGNSFLDCTLGLATDSIVASFAVGVSGEVKGIEADRDVAFITAAGLAQFEPKFQELQDSMRRISVIQDSAMTVLSRLPDQSWDVVYLDPMFSQTISESTSFAPLKQAGVQGSLTEEWVSEAIRVAGKRVVVKAHFSDAVFERFGFTRINRPNTKFHFGYIEK